VTVPLKDPKRTRSDDGVDVVPRSLHCATAEGAVASVGMTAEEGGGHKSGRFGPSCGGQAG